MEDTENYSSTLAYEVVEDNYLETSGTNPSQDKQEFDSDYLTIRACAELVEENCMESAFSSQDPTVPTTIDEALQDSTWKKAMMKSMRL